MKYLIILLIILSSTFSAIACTCFEDISLCESFKEYVTHPFLPLPPVPNNLDDRLICYVEYTGNFNLYNDAFDLYRYEVKVIDLIFGTIQSGTADFANSDSTFWLISGATSCHDNFSFQEGDFALVAPEYGYATEDGFEYGFSVCEDDLFIYPSPLEPVQYNNVVQDIEECLSYLCDDDLTLSEPHEQSAVYKAGLITSTSYVNAAQVVYKANERVSLQSDFRTNKDYDFRVVMDSCD